MVSQVNGDAMMFVPSFRPVNGVTSKDWARISVAPDREVD